MAWIKDILSTRATCLLMVSDLCHKAELCLGWLKKLDACSGLTVSHAACRL